MAAIKPRDAASLMLYRSKQGSFEVLMGRRPSKSRFMPDVYVFPGGAVDAADARAKPATPLCESCAKHMAVAGSLARAQTIAMAVVRETFEETGLLIASRGTPGVVKDATWQTLAMRGVSADLSVLQYFGRAITPADQPIRFNARFFICDSQRVDSLNTDELTQSDELLDLRWIPIHNPDELALRDITKFLLHEMDIWLNRREQWLGYPAFTKKAGKRVVSRSG